MRLVVALIKPARPREAESGPHSALPSFDVEVDFLSVGRIDPNRHEAASELSNAPRASETESPASDTLRQITDRALPSESGYLA